MWKKWLYTPNPSSSQYVEEVVVYTQSMYQPIFGSTELMSNELADTHSTHTVGRHHPRCWQLFHLRHNVWMLQFLQHRNLPYSGGWYTFLITLQTYLLQRHQPVAFLVSTLIHDTVGPYIIKQLFVCTCLNITPITQHIYTYMPDCIQSYITIIINCSS